MTRERVLRERQNARYHAIVDSAPDAIITTSLDRTIQWVNGAAEHVFGYAASELLSQKIDILLDPGRRSCRAPLVLNASRGSAYPVPSGHRPPQGWPDCQFRSVVWTLGGGRSPVRHLDLARRDGAHGRRDGATRKRKSSSHVVGGIAPAGLDLWTRWRLRLLQSAMAGLYRRPAGGASWLGLDQRHP